MSGPNAETGFGKAFFTSAIIGAYGGMTVTLAVQLFKTPLPVSRFWEFPAVALGYGSIALPIAIIGLAIFGLPVTFVLRRHSFAWWMGVIAIMWGGLTGKLLGYLFLQVLLSGNDSVDIGVLPGVLTGLAWWRFRVRQLNYVSRPQQAMKG